MSFAISERDAHELQSNIEQLHEMVDALRHALAAADEENTALRSELERRVQENLHTPEQHREIMSLNDMLALERDSGRRIADTLARAELDRDAARRETQQVTFTLSELQNENASLRTRCTALDSALHEQRQAAAALATDRAAAVAALSEANAAAERYRVAAEHAAAELAAANRSSAIEARRFADCERARVSLVGELEGVRGQMRELELRLTTVNGDVGTERARADAAMQEAAKATAELETQLGYVAEMEQLVSELRVVAACNATSLEKAEAQASSAAADAQSNERSVSTLRAALADSNALVRSLQAEVSLQQTKVFEAQQAEARQRARVERVTAEMAALTRDMVRARLGVPPKSPTTN